MYVLEALKILLAGLIDGLTNFLPISSSGHLAIMRNIFHFGVEESCLFDSFLSLATIIVILVGFKKDFIKLLYAFFEVIAMGLGNAVTFFKNLFVKEKDDYYQFDGAYRKMALMIIVATFATGVVGYAGRTFAAYAATTRYLVGAGFVVTGVMLFLISNQPKGHVSVKDATYLSAFVVGAAQGLSVLPGMARCGLVIATCLMFGYETKLLRRFVFLVAVPSLIGDIILNIADMISGGVTDVRNIGWYLLAFLLAIVTGYVGLIIVNKAIKKGKYLGFALYCLIAGAFTFASMIVL